MTWETTVLPLVTALIGAAAVVVAAWFKRGPFTVRAKASERSPARHIPGGLYRVLARSSTGETVCEQLRVAIHGPIMTVRSPQWESTGLFVDGRYCGRFKHYRGSAATDMGHHDFTWDGRQLVGCCRFDDGCGTGNLIWRPA